MQNIAKKISERRKFLKIRQFDLAEIAGVSLRTIKAVEKGEANPTLSTTELILNPLGLKLDVTNRITYE